MESTLDVTVEDDRIRSNGRIGSTTPRPARLADVDVTHPRLWGDRFDQLCGAQEPEHGFIPGSCQRAH